MPLILGPSEPGGDSLGYANRTLAYHLPHKNRKLGAELRGRLQRLGILRETGHEHFNGAVVFPVMGEAGLALDLYGRRLSSETDGDLYLPGTRRGVWNLVALQASTEIIVCASVIDALTFWCHGIRHVTATLNAEAPPQLGRRSRTRGRERRRVSVTLIPPSGFAPPAAREGPLALPTRRAWSPSRALLLECPC